MAGLAVSVTVLALFQSLENLVRHWFKFQNLPLLCVRVLCSWRKESRFPLPGWLAPSLTRGAPCTHSQSVQSVHLSALKSISPPLSAPAATVCLFVGGTGIFGRRMLHHSSRAGRH